MGIDRNKESSNIAQLLRNRASVDTSCSCGGRCVFVERLSWSRMRKKTRVTRLVWIGNAVSRENYSLLRVIRRELTTDRQDSFTPTIKNRDHARFNGGSVGGESEESKSLSLLCIIWQRTFNRFRKLCGVRTSRNLCCKYWWVYSRTAEFLPQHFRHVLITLSRHHVLVPKYLYMEAMALLESHDCFCCFYLFAIYTYISSRVRIIFDCQRLRSSHIDY